jgi:ribonuclease P protein component
MVASRPRPAGSYGKADRLVRTGEYKRVYNRGFRSRSHRFGCYVLPSRRARSRLGISVSRKYGDSHLRNRIKRQVREAFRTIRGELPVPVDLVVVPRRAAHGSRLGEICDEIEQLVREALETRSRKALGRPGPRRRP